MYTINFVNQNTDIPTAYVTFIQATQVVNNVTELVGPALNATGGNGTTLENGVSYSLDSIQNTISMDPSNWQGHMYLSDAALTPPTSGGLPVDMAYTLTTDTNRYQMIEFAGSATSATTDITYINWYSIPVQMETTTSNTGGNSRGVPSSQTALSDLISTLAGLSGNSSTTVVKNSSNETVRIISPNAGNPSWLPLYESFRDYLVSVFIDSTDSILLSNSYSGIQNPPSLDFQAQTYSASSVTYNGLTLNITGTTSVLGNFTMTATMVFADFSSVIYLAVMNYEWSYDGQNGSASNPTGNTGDNNVFSAISRDLMAGFNFGFVGSSQYGSQPSSAWQQASDSELFSAIQPNKPYYNPWANAINGCFSDVYSFPFNDFLSNFSPLLTTNDGDILTVTLLNP
ncbi:MAG TPA: hypothetical protein PLL06_02710 [Acidobacteriota bacterium]|nr:hypothetical protein [Acidobacteriota bacterium]